MKESYTINELLLQNSGNNSEITSINDSLNELIEYLSIGNQNRFLAGKDKEPLQKITNELIDKCERYIQKSPKELRDYEHQHRNIENLDLLQKIVTIQKKVYSLSILPVKKERKIGSRWDFFRSTIGSKKDKTIGLKHEFWSEKYYNGSIDILLWLQSNSLLSFAEAQQKESNKILYQSAKKQPLLIKNGVLYLEEDKPFDNADSFSYFRRARGDIFAMNKEQEILILNCEENTTKYRHSSINEGKPVLCAGTIVAVNGKIHSIDVLSGHYQPKPENLLNMLVYLKSQNVPLEHVLVRPEVNNKFYEAIDFIDNKGDINQLTEVPYVPPPSKEDVLPPISTVTSKYVTGIEIEKTVVTEDQVEPNTDNDSTEETNNSPKQ